jgi:hypothetical protein
VAPNRRERSSSTNMRPIPIRVSLGRSAVPQPFRDKPRF